MIRTLLIDLDGVVIIRKAYFSQRYAELFGTELNKDSILSFFKTSYKQCAVGKADLKDELAHVLSSWGWMKSMDELLEFWFSGERNVDRQLVDHLQSVRQSGVKTYLVSDNEKYRLADLKKHLSLDQWFDGIFCSCEVGFTKDQPEFYQEVLKTLNITNPSEVLFCDDDEKNVLLAEKAHMVVKTYKGIDGFQKDIQELGIHV